ncbi:MAG: diacylglycerol kinase [Succinivibrio sp.]|nr:diacylglycerol kinase [Succinivibrio sp.]
MSKQQPPGLTRLVKAFKYSMQGFKAGFANEAAIRQEFALSAVLTALAFVLSDSVTELILLIALPWLTVAFELLNSAIEAVVDRIGPQWHELSGRAKDLGSACVFVLLCLTCFGWAAVLLSKVYAP